VTDDDDDDDDDDDRRSEERISKHSQDRERVSGGRITIAATEVATHGSFLVSKFILRFV
jgi:hypothetical protein